MSSFKEHRQLRFVQMITLVLIALAGALAALLAWLGFQNDPLSATSYLGYIALATVVLLAGAGFWMARALPLLDQGARAYKEITRQLARREKELQQTSKLQALGALLGGVAHDFNNLLTAILGHADTLLIGMTAEHPHYSSLQEIRSAAERAASLTSQLHAFHRFESGRPQPVNLNQLLRGMEELLSRLLREDILVTLECDAALDLVQVDPAQIEQAIVNLALNARDAMPQGGTLVLRTEALEIEKETAARLNIEPARYARVRIEDTGCGMSEETLQRAFEPFFTTKERGPGSGLGLTNVLQVVTQSRGYVRMESEAGVGTRLDLYLPTHHPEPASPPALQESGAGSTPPTVLVAEDEEQVRKLLVDGLSRIGYRVLEAASGDEALHVSDGFPNGIDLVITDVVMPGMRGPDLVREVERRRGAIRAVYISGYSDEDVLKQTNDDQHLLLPKPFTLDQLSTTVHRALRRAPSVSQHKPVR